MSATTSSASDPEKIFAALHDSLRRYLRRRVGDVVADDLLQDVFIKAMTAINDDRAPDNLAGWLFTVARTTAIDFYRARRADPEMLDDNYADNSHEEDEHLHQELATCLKPFVNQLPGKYRETLLATDFAGKTMQTVANEQGLSISAIKSRASRGRAMLKEKLLECCYVETAGGRVTEFYQKSPMSCGESNNPESGGF
jgi:RNA polymerase sigma-70 factor (ECF subfamily)